MILWLNFPKVFPPVFVFRMKDQMSWNEFQSLINARIALVNLISLCYLYEGNIQTRLLVLLQR